jgi:hypothetical protein
VFGRAHQVRIHSGGTSRYSAGVSCCLVLVVCANEPFGRGYPAERGPGELQGETPNGLNASANLPEGDKECQHLFFRRTVDFNSTNVASFPFACTTKRFASSRCASAIHIVRPFASMGDTQLQPALLRLSAMISHFFRAWLLLTDCS